MIAFESRRQQPCSACVRRKRTQFCSFEDEDGEAPWALASEVRAINRRLNHLESLFQQQQNTSSSSNGFHSNQASTSRTPYFLPDANLSTRSNGQSTNPSPDNHNQAQDAPSPTHSDTESAVVELEDVAFSTRVPVLRALNAAAQGNAGPRYAYPGRVDMELTDASTSILAEPLTFDQDGRPREFVAFS
jgi:hypothetical protein